MNNKRHLSFFSTLKSVYKSFHLQLKACLMRSCVCVRKCRTPVYTCETYMLSIVGSRVGCIQCKRHGDILTFLLNLKYKVLYSHVFKCLAWVFFYHVCLSIVSIVPPLCSCLRQTNIVAIFLNLQFEMA